MILSPPKQERWRGTLKPPHVGNITYEKLLSFNSYALKETQEGALASINVSFNLLAIRPLEESQLASLKSTFGPLPPPPTDTRFKRRGVLSTTSEDWPILLGTFQNYASTITALRGAANVVEKLEPPSRDAVVLDFGRLSDSLATILGLPGPRVIVDLNRTLPPLVILRIRTRLTYGPSHLRDDFDEMIRRGFLRSDHQQSWLSEDVNEMDAFFKEHHLYVQPNPPLQDQYNDFYPTPQKV